MNTSNSISHNEIALIQANAAPLSNRNLYWVLSRKQIVYVLQEIEETVSELNTEFAQARYLDEKLPVINLEQYYGINDSDNNRAQYYLVVQVARADASIGKVIIPSRYPARIRKLDFETVSADKKELFTHSDDILGLFFSDEKETLVAPDIAAILERNVNNK